MLQKIADTMLDKHEYDLVIQNVQIVNVYNDTMKKVPRYPGNLLPGGIGITFDRYID